MIADFDRRLASLARGAERGQHPTAVIYQVGGSVSGAGSLADAALAAAGFRNMAADYRLTRGGQVPLEAAAGRPPDLLVLSSGADEYRTALADNLRHPVHRPAAPASAPRSSCRGACGCAARRTSSRRSSGWPRRAAASRRARR